jgi:hypothetical protein
MLIHSNQPPIVRDGCWLATEVDANIEVVVIPIRLMISTPFSGFVHLGDVAINLAAVFAVTAFVAVDSGSVRLKSAPTIFSIVPISASRRAEGKH